MLAVSIAKSQRDQTFLAEECDGFLEHAPANIPASVQRPIVDFPNHAPMRMKRVIGEYFSSISTGKHSQGAYAGWIAQAK